MGARNDAPFMWFFPADNLPAHPARELDRRTAQRQVRGLQNRNPRDLLRHAFPRIRPPDRAGRHVGRTACRPHRFRRHRTSDRRHRRLPRGWRLDSAALARRLRDRAHRVRGDQGGSRAGVAPRQSACVDARHGAVGARRTDRTTRARYPTMPPHRSFRRPMGGPISPTVIANRSSGGRKLGETKSRPYRVGNVPDQPAAGQLLVRPLFRAALFHPAADRPKCS